MTDVRIGERNGLDTGEAAAGKSDMPMEMALEMATPVTLLTKGFSPQAI
jgi:hypothetical protein